MDEKLKKILQQLCWNFTFNGGERQMDQAILAIKKAGYVKRNKSAPTKEKK